VAGGVVAAATNLDQTAAGDQWHVIATVRLGATNGTYVRLTAPAGPCVADALRLWSNARYNNGQAVGVVKLQPMDGIVLRRDVPVIPAPRFQRAGVAAGQVWLSVTNLTPGMTNELLQTTNLVSGTWQSRTTFQSPGFVSDIADGSVTNRSQSYYRIRVP